MERSSQHSEPSVSNATTAPSSLASTRPPVAAGESAGSVATATATAATAATATATGTAATSSSKNNERSAVVLALFGPSVGPCVGDFSTTYNRVNGRLYAATRSILFYSNLFGFERRLCLNLLDIESIEAYRSTSIRINMVDCEDHVFRKIFDRDQVLKLLQELYEQEASSFRSHHGPLERPPITDIDATPIRRTNNTEMTTTMMMMDDNPSEGNPTMMRARFESDISQPDSDNNAAQEEELSSSPRPRSQSVPSMKALLGVQEKPAKPEKAPKVQLDLTSRTRKFRRSMSLRSPGRQVAPTVVIPSSAPASIEAPALSPASGNHNNNNSGGDDVDNISAAATSATVSGPTTGGAPPGFDMDKAWAEAKQPYSEVALKNVALLCSLEAFMDMFVSNDASFHIARYQKESIQDKNLSYSKWKKRQATDAAPSVFPPIFDRDISFVHPLNNSVGPSQAKTTRQQRFQRFGALGATLQNITVVQGVPGAECFRVEDRWIVENIGDSSVRLSVYFQIVFSKRTMFKPIIQKNVKTETKKWFQGYAKFLKHALQEDDKKDGRSAPPSPIASDTETEPILDEQGDGDDSKSLRPLVSPPTFLLGMGLVLVLCLIVLQLFHLQQSVQILQDQLISIREENKELQATMKQMIASKKC